MKNKNKIKTIGMIGLASILLVPMKASANILSEIFNDYWSIGIECSARHPDYSEISQKNLEKNNQMRPYIPGWIDIPNPGQMEIRGIMLYKPIHADMLNLVHDIEPEALIGIYSGESKADYSQSYGGDYKQVNSNESINTLEIRLGLKAGKVKRLHSFSYSASAGLAFDKVSYNKSRLTVFSDSTSGEIKTNAEGTGAGYFINLRTEYMFSPNMSAEIGIGMKKSTVKTRGTESFMDSYDSDNNYNIDKEIAVGLDGTECMLGVKYNF
jgi:hypothetical protein